MEGYNYLIKRVCFGKQLKPKALGRLCGYKGDKYMKHIREDLSIEERSLDVGHYIDPGFVNYRLIETVLGEKGMEEINRRISLLPDDPEWLRKTKTGHIYTRIMLAFCKVVEIPTLGELLFKGKGRMFCSTEELVAVEGVYEKSRLTVPIKTKGDYGYEVFLEFGTEHIHSDTLKTELDQGNTLSIIAVNPKADGKSLTFQPLIIGSPWLEIDNPDWKSKIIWWGYEYYEHFIEDIDEFSECRKIPMPTVEDAKIMKQISENAFKHSLAKILGDGTVKDWGGEMSDHFSSHFHLNGKRVKAAFLLKGPANFTTMSLNHLGKNNDQIYRLSKEPADLLVVQHSHDISPAVQETLRAFAVQPSNPRRYMLIDGRDSLRLLKAYDLLDFALEMSKN